MQLLARFILLLAASPAADAAGVLRATSRGAGAPAPAPAPAPAAAVTAPGAGSGAARVQELADLLPYHPASMPQTVFKSRCVNFLNGVMEKSSFEPEIVKSMLPKCRWTPAQCSVLEADLAARLAPVPASSSAKAPSVGSSDTAGGSDGGYGEGAWATRLYGWCDQMYAMTKAKAFSEAHAAPYKF
eukprot:TRINITY_DN30932_c0_g1_i1.p1 TRINITY_DN30932_c0_g1~~TRINITY_DN30932_c0_g1_i1.p1  ORF type:complete len:208 (-),score=43.64 TRINITY_DN30932_c0_g1_i1:66-623(-)